MFCVISIYIDFAVYDNHNYNLFSSLSKTFQTSGSFCKTELNAIEGTCKRIHFLLHSKSVNDFSYLANSFEITQLPIFLQVYLHSFETTISKLKHYKHGLEYSFNVRTNQQMYATRNVQKFYIIFLDFLVYFWL